MEKTVQNTMLVVEYLWQFLKRLEVWSNTVLSV